jgi:HAMP domain-containing protein
LTTAFLVMVLGPVVLSALFVGVAVERLGQERADQRLELATANVRTAVGALCAQLSTVAETIAAAPAERRLGLSGQFVERGLASGVHLARGADGANTKGAPPLPWADCAGSVEKGPGIAAGYSAIAAQVATPDGALVTAAFTADLALVKRLGAASGADVTLLGGTGVRPPTTETALTGMRRVADSVPLSPAPSTLEDASAVARVADTLADGGAGRADTGDLVRRIGPVAGEPLPIAVSVPVGSPRGTQMMLVSVVLLTALAAVGVASWLARTATSPLAGLAAAADRVAAGDLHTRVPARGRDEVAHLATAFNRMTRELETYVSALTASRDQLRGNLGILGETLSSTHDRDRILQVILHTARQATQASGAIVLLADSGGELVGKCAEGLRREASEVRVPIGQGLCGAVAATACRAWAGSTATARRSPRANRPAAPTSSYPSPPRFPPARHGRGRRPRAVCWRSTTAWAAATAATTSTTRT